MKMSDIFELPVSPEPDATWYGHKGANTTRAEFERATAHAVNCHDDLVAALYACEASITEFMRVYSSLVFDCDKRAVEEARAAIAKARGEG